MDQQERKSKKTRNTTKGIETKESKGKQSKATMEPPDADQGCERKETGDALQGVSPMRKRKRLEELLSSSSSEERHCNVKTVVFDEHAEGKYAEEVLYKYLDDREIATLVGLATTNGREYDNPVISKTSVASSATNTPSENNPLVGLPNSPLPPSHLNYIARRSLESPSFKPDMERRFDHSALVAIGMFLEEMITASLLPLAGCHVMRCRELEARSSETYLQESGFAKSEIHPITGQNVGKLIAQKQQAGDANDVYEEWTLPPEEALQKVAKEQKQLLKHCFLPTSLSVTRTMNDSEKREAEQSTSTSWCREQHLDTTFVRKNMDVFGLFIPSPPIEGSLPNEDKNP